MAFRFRRSFKIAPGIRLNLNSKSTSVRLGPKGFGYTISSNGKSRVSAGIPGTGISYSQAVSPPRPRSSPTHNQATTHAPRRRGVLGYFVAAIGIILGITIFNNAATTTPRSSTAAHVSQPETPDANSLVGDPLTIQPQPPATALVPRQDVAPAPPAPAPPSDKHETRYVTASSLNVRSSPSTSGEIVAKIGNAHEIAVIDSSNGWLLVQLAAGVQGWVSEQYTSRTKVAPPLAQALVSSLPAQNRDAIVQEIINRSIRNYSGACPCPYNTMRSGRRCGGNSAYSKPGGRSPVCFASDVTEAMIASFRQ